jgi:hypothetical protein
MDNRSTPGPLKVVLPAKHERHLAIAAAVAAAPLYGSKRSP